MSQEETDLQNVSGRPQVARWREMNRFSRSILVSPMRSSAENLSQSMTVTVSVWSCVDTRHISGGKLGWCYIQWNPSKADNLEPQLRVRCRGVSIKRGSTVQPATHQQHVYMPVLSECDSTQGLYVGSSAECNGFHL